MTQPSLPALVERQAELDLLTEAAAGAPAVAFVEGEAGIGKTRLMQELLAHPALGHRERLLGHCHRLAEPFPLGPFVDALQGLGSGRIGAPLDPVVGALRPLLGELADALPQRPAPLGDAGAERHRVFRALRALLDHLGPTVCVLEDLHWADAGTLEFLFFLVSDLPEELSLVLTYRREELGSASPASVLLALGSRVQQPARTVSLALAPLSATGVHALVGSFFATDSIATEFTDQVHAKTAGIPFAIEEVLRLVGARRDLVSKDGRERGDVLDELGVPPCLRDFTLERTARLPPGARMVVEAAAILACAADEALLSEVAGLAGTAAADAVSDAVAAGVLREVSPRGYGFRHVLAGQSVYDGLPCPRRVRLHLRAADALERARPQPVAHLAHHYKAAGRVDDWVRCALAAAHLARSSFDDASAAAFLREVLGEADLPPTDRGRVAVMLGQAAWSAHNDQRASVELLEGVVRDTSLPAGVRGELRFLLGGLLHLSGDASGAHREHALALADLRRRPGLAAQVMVTLGAPWTVDGHERDHLRWLDAAVSVAGRQRDPARTFAVRAERATTLVSIGHADGWRAVRELPDRPSSVHEARELRFRVGLSGAAFHLGHYDRAKGLLEQVAAQTADRGLRMFPSAQTTHLLLDWATGAWQGLDERARSHAEIHEFSFYWVAGVRVSGQLCLAMGDREQAQVLLERSCAGAAAAGTIPGLAAAAGALARLRLDAGDAPAARTDAARALQVIERKGIWSWAGEVAPNATRALLACDDVGAAQGLVKRFASGLERRDAPIARAGLTVCRAELARSEGRHHAAARLYTRAQRQFAALPRPYEAAQAQTNAGLCLLEAGRPDGREAVLAALGAFERLGASFDASQTRRMLRLRGVAVAHPGSRGQRGYGDELSPREQEVVRLAARGLTNAEIAGVLLISPKTVEHHVASALRKLGVATKRKLVGHVLTA